MSISILSMKQCSKIEDTPFSEKYMCNVCECKYGYNDMYDISKWPEDFLGMYDISIMANDHVKDIFRTIKYDITMNTKFSPFKEIHEANPWSHVFEVNDNGVAVKSNPYFDNYYLLKGSLESNHHYDTIHRLTEELDIDYDSIFKDDD